MSEPVLCNSSGHLIKDHKTVTCLLNLSRPAAMKREVSCQNLREINVLEFKKDLVEAFSFSSLNDCVDNAVDDYNVNVKKVITKHAPKQAKTLLFDRTHFVGMVIN